MVTHEKGRHNLLRPEALEAMFVQWRITRNPIYKDWGWQILQAFQTHCRVRQPLLLQALMVQLQTEGCCLMTAPPDHMLNCRVGYGLTLEKGSTNPVQQPVALRVPAMG